MENRRKIRFNGRRNKKERHSESVSIISNGHIINSFITILQFIFAPEIDILLFMNDDGTTMQALFIFALHIQR